MSHLSVQVETLFNELTDLYSMREKAKSDDFWRKEVDEKILQLLRDNLKPKSDFLTEPESKTLFV